MATEIFISMHHIMKCIFGMEKLNLKFQGESEIDTDVSNMFTLLLNLESQRSEFCLSEHKQKKIVDAIS